MADEYVAFGKDSPARTVTEPGEAKVLGTTSGTANFESDWRPWAYSAGGALLSYLLADALTGGEERGKDGKKKEKGWLKTIAPYLAAAGGALGGYALSGVGKGVGEKGQKGEYVIKKNDDGTISQVDMPSEGTAGYVAAGTLGAGAAGSGTRGVLNHRYHVAQRSQNVLDALSARSAREAANAENTRALNELENVRNEYKTAITKNIGKDARDEILRRLAAAESEYRTANSAFVDSDNAFRNALRVAGIDDRALAGLQEDTIKRLTRQAATIQNPEGRIARGWLNNLSRDVPDHPSGTNGFFRRAGRRILNGRGNLWATVLQLIGAMGAGAYGYSKGSDLDDIRKATENAGYYVNKE